MKWNFKNYPTDDKNFRFCHWVLNETVEDSVENEINPEEYQKYPDETQERLKICEGTKFKRRGLDTSKWQGILQFWMRISTRL